MEELAKENFSFLTKPSLDTNGAKLGSFGVVFIMLKSALDAVLLIFLWAFKKAGGIHSILTLIHLHSSLPVCVSIYELITDQRFVLFLLCLFFISPLSVPKGIGIQKYTRCGTVCITVYSSIENRKLSHWVFISVVSMFICLIIYSLTGVFGYLTFGKNIAPDILMLYSGGKLSVIQDPLLRRRHKHTAVTESYESWTRVALTTVWVTITLLIAVFVPDISKVISVVGVVSTFFIFIFPGNCCCRILFWMFNKMYTYSFTFTITFCLYALFCPRYLLITWGMITLFCGTYIFGENTSIAIMQLISDI
uniref:Solute carrier family 38 member 8a n=1 Tax=Cyprinus carpio TaxID=7962 RepID=A0A8C2KPI1_CYPCA